MAMGMYRGVDGIARKVTKIYRGVDSVARQVKAGYRGVDNVARQFYASSFNAISEWTSSDWIKKTNSSGTTSITSSKITLNTAAHYQSYAILISPAFDVTGFSKVTITGDYGSYGSGGDGAYIVDDSVSTPDADVSPSTYDKYLGNASDGASKTIDISSITGKKRLYLCIKPNYPEDLGGSTAVADTQYYTSIKFHN